MGPEMKSSTASIIFQVSVLAAIFLLPRSAGTQEGTTKYAEIEVKDGGRVSGKVTFKGAVPELVLAVTQDKEKCHHEGGDQKSPRLKVNATGGVAETVVYLKAIAQGKPMKAMKAARRLDQEACAYVPFVQVAPFKDTIEIINSDPLNHNVHGRIGAEDAFNLAMPNTAWPQKQTIAKRLTRPGIITVNCDVHNWMSAYIWSVRHPYYAVTAEDGSYELADIPPGEYELAIWHPGWDAQVTKNASGQPAGYSYGPAIEKSAKIKVTAKAAQTADFVLND